MTPGERAQSAVLNFLARDLGRAIYLQQKHIRANDGSCNGCCTQLAPTEFPCIVRRLADECISRQIPLQRRASE